MDAVAPYPKAVALFPRVRQSLLSAYDQCALSSKFEMDFAEGWATHPQARGRIFHRVAAKILAAAEQMGERTVEVDVGLAILHETIQQNDVDRECPACGTDEILPGAPDGFRTCANGHRFESDFVNLPQSQIEDLYWVTKKFCFDNVWSVETLVDIEKRLDAVVAYSVEGISVQRTISGQLDLLFVEGEFDDHAIVVDYKDTWGLPAPTEVSFEGYFQQRFYGFLVLANYPSVQAVTLREFYARYSTPREATIYRETIHDIHDELAAMVQRFDRSIEEELWPPTPGKQCSWCLRPTACPIPKFVRGKGKIETEAEAEKTARQLIVASAIVEQTKGALSSWTDKHGPVEIRDAKGIRVWGPHEAKRTSRPNKDEILAKLALNEGRLARPEVDAMYKEATVTRYEPHVPKPGKADDSDAEFIASLGEAVAEAKARRELG